MDWGDVPAWAALVLVIVGGVWSWHRTQRAINDAEEAKGFASRQAEATERLAEIAQQRLDLIASTGPDTSVNPAVTFEFVWYDGSAFLLRNLGTTTATNIKLEGLENLISKDDVPSELAPLRSAKFIVEASLAHPLPHEVTAYCDQLRTGQVLPWPPTG